MYQLFALYNQKEELHRVRRELDFANEQLEDATRDKRSQASGMADVSKRQIHELKDSLRVRCVTCSPVVGLLR